MLIGQQQPLEIASKVLKAETMQALRNSPSYNLQGWKILDRWAFNSPDRLIALETEGEVILLGRLLEQQTIEQTVLSRAIEQLQAGSTPHEILEQNEINTEL
ncbi:hypothetical protein [Pseudomonas monteilii]|uniref:hypothetical protein n=1 Tax=Pseudomonas monteilii TaxID=76759 RepID=UPI001C70B9FF|nr:hypothetical protein [Pseudomonas monteilii]